MVIRPTAKKTREQPVIAAMKGKWLDIVFDDPQLPFRGPYSAYKLAPCMTMTESARRYTKTGRIYVNPSLAFLTEKFGGKSRDTVRRGIQDLIENKHLRLVKRGNQKTGANEYEILFRGKTARDYNAAITH